MEKKEKLPTLHQIKEETRKTNATTFAALFGERLREFRLKRGLLQKEFAEKIGVTTSRYANWEQGRREPGIYDLFLIIQNLEIEPNDLFDFKECTKFFEKDVEDFLDNTDEK